MSRARHTVNFTVKLSVDMSDRMVEDCYLVDAEPHTDMMDTMFMLKVARHCFRNNSRRINGLTLHSVEPCHELHPQAPMVVVPQCEPACL